MEDHGYNMNCVVEYLDAHLTLLQGIREDVYSCRQISVPNHNGADGRESKNDNGNLRTFPNTSEQVEPVYAPQSVSGQHEISLWGSIR